MYGAAWYGPTGTDWVFTGSMRFPGDVLATFDCGTAMPNRDELEVSAARARSSSTTRGTRRAGDRAAPATAASSGSRSSTRTRTSSSWRTSTDAANGEAELLLGRDDAMGQARALEALHRSARDAAQPVSL